jgi:hypothetical protein
VLGHVVARRQQHASVAARAEVLGRIERQAGGVAPAADGTAVPGGPHGLGGVLEHGQPARPRQRGDPVHRCRVTVQVYRHDDLRPRCHRPLDRGDVERQRLVVHVDEDRTCAGHHDGRGRGDEREGRRDHLVTGADAEGREREPQRIGARAHADAVPGPAELRQLLLEGAAVGAEHERARVEHPLGGVHELGLQRGVLPLEIQKRNHFCPPGVMAPTPTLVPMGPPTPSRLTANRISSS